MLGKGVVRVGGSQMRHTILTLLMIFSSVCFGKTKIDVPDFSDETDQNPCRAVEPWQRDIGFALRQQLVTALESSGQFTIVEAELLRGEKQVAVMDPSVSTIHKKRTFKAAQYSVVGVLKSFNACDVKTSSTAQVELEIRVVDVASDEVVQAFTTKGLSQMPVGRVDKGFRGASFNTGLFKDSPLGVATKKAVADAADLLKKIFPDREVASNTGYRVQTIRKGRRR
jgi:curli biogenesis system outer membrane secretion channel CsgG